MKAKLGTGILSTITLVTITLLIGGGTPARVMAPPGETVYVEPALFSVEAENLSVIVTAGDSQAAARAVERVGGQVTSDLWLIDAVAAMIPARQLETLAAYPGIRSVVNNKGIQTADGPDEDGWVTEIRVQRGVHILEAVQYTPAAYLPDGGFVSIDERGTVLIVNADGSERALVSLSGGPFKTAVVVAEADGTIYVAGENKRVYALNSDGSRRWVFSKARKRILASVALGPDGTVYIADEERNVYALDPATGQALWQFSVRRDGAVKAAPAVGPDGTLYVLTEKGYLFAINPDGSLRWTFIASDGEPFKQSPQVGANGTLYIVGEEKRVFAVNPNGSLKYEFATASKILAQPALAADGSLYVAAEDRSLYGVNPDGTERFLFRPAAGKFKTSPVLSPDGESVYAAVEEGTLFAVDAASGAERWRYTAIEKIQASPALDAAGNVVVGSEGRDLVILSPKGVSLYSTRLSDRITQSVSVSPSGNVNVRVGDRTVVALGRLPDHWDGRPDVQPADGKGIWQLVNPVAVDVGADVLHRQALTGQGVTVAVVDSGVYFDKEVKTELGAQVEHLFLGQADFVDSICETYQQNRNRISVFGTQYDGYCFTDSEHSKDAYGHGTHIAGSVWNNFADYTTGVAMGIAPDASILSVRVLGGDGRGTYEDVIRGIQYVVENKDAFNIRVLNLSLSAYATTPYFVDPLNRAAEAAWASGIVVLAAAGNTGPAAESITVPGNDPYVITVGAVDSNRTPGYWADDILPAWSATGPTLDGFLKPDVLAPGANIVSFMYNDPDNIANSAWLVQQHPDYSETTSLFRMSGTSMATAAASGVVALMLEAHPELTPDQIKFRLVYTARAADTEEGDLVYNIFQQGVGRIWAPDAVLGDLPADGVANGDMDINADLAHGWETDEDIAYHYEGLVQKLLSDDGQAYLYYVTDEDGNNIGLGVAWEEGLTWVDQDALSSGRMAWSGGQMTWSGGMSWAGGLSSAAGRMAWSGGRMAWSGGRMAWSGGRMAWSGGRMAWSGGRMAWSGGRMAWSGGRMAWSGGRMAWSGGLAWAGGRMAWSGGLDTDSACVSTTTWVDEWYVDD